MARAALQDVLREKVIDLARRPLVDGEPFSTDGPSLARQTLLGHIKPVGVPQEFVVEHHLPVDGLRGRTNAVVRAEGQIDFTGYAFDQ